MSVQASIEDGFGALEAWAWEEARAIFAEGVSEQEGPEALEGPGAATFWLEGRHRGDRRTRAGLPAVPRSGRQRGGGARGGRAGRRRPHVSRRAGGGRESIYRFEGGKVVEMWDAWNVLAVMEQLGLSSRTGA